MIWRGCIVLIGRYYSKIHQLFEPPNTSEDSNSQNNNCLPAKRAAKFVQLTNNKQITFPL